MTNSWSMIRLSYIFTVQFFFFFLWLFTVYFSWLFQIMTVTHPLIIVLRKLVILSPFFLLYIYIFFFQFDRFITFLNNNVTFIKYDYWTENINIPDEHQVHHFQCRQIDEGKNMPLTGGWWFVMTITNVNDGWVADATFSLSSSSKTK